MVSDVSNSAALAQSRHIQPCPVPGVAVLSERISNVICFINANIGAALTVADLASVARVSPRQLARLFKEETGLTPAKAVELQRLRLAHERTLQTAQPMKRIAEEFGFLNIERMRRAFSRNLGAPPGQLRKRFSRQLSVCRGVDVSRGGPVHSDKSVGGIS